ncbi:penicillin acylase family protein [Microtetraspora fusca]|uniref:Penicillin acylase family protein n=1 Tax=Microtetraspora fusca TaxID=1997 RepID=A0ABW6VJG4_MICFU
MVRLAPYARFPWPIRWLLRVVTVVLVLALVLAGVVTWTVRRSFPQVDGEIRLPGLAASVSVLRDRYGVPQIYADTSADLFKAQGYVHAQDRFWEMDFRRKTTAGRLSELFGSSTLDIDKVVRTLGWRRTSEKEIELLDPEARTALEDYAAGVNAWMEQNQGFAARSLEYGVLALTNRSYEPEPWTPADSLSWLKALAWDLRSNMGEEIERAIDASALPLERVEELFPGYPFDRHQPIVTRGAVRDGKFSQDADEKRATGAPAQPAAPLATRPVTGSATEQERASDSSLSGAPATEALARVAKVLDAVPNLLGTSGADRAGIGSNSWVVSGAHTESGKPLLANDPHLGPRMPSIWYQAGLHCRTRGPACPYDVSGYTFSGVPGVIIGHNHKIAWGFTNLGPDVTDLYVERVQDDRYEVKGSWVPLQTRVEQIKVAGGKTVELAVRSTAHGPIISEVLGNAREAVPGAAAKLGKLDKDMAVALRWTALDPGRTGDSIFMLNRAENWEQFRAAAAQFEAPAQNLIYADLEGNIGYQAPGKIPVRSDGDGMWPAAGWTGAQEWTGYIPFEQLPYVYNPPEGFIVTANNAAIRPDYGPFLTSDWSYGYRSQRIVDRITRAVGAGKITADTMRDIQMDSRNGLAEVLVPHLLRSGGGDTRLLKGWDFTQTRDSAPAAYYNAIWRHLLKRTFDDDLPESVRPGGGDRWFEVVAKLLDEPDSPWWDDTRTEGVTESRDDILAAAIKDAGADLRERLGDDPDAWRWGDLHTLELTNETFGTSGIGPVEWLFNRGPLHLAGGKDAVDATGWDSDMGYEVVWVPSMRMVVDLADLDRSRWINLTGASGHAFHSNYDDQAELWADGRMTPWPFTEQGVRREAVDTLTLTP